MKDNYPKVAIIGRPNVGKSTLFNRLVRRKRSIIHEQPGITRDRSYELVREIPDKPFYLIDTGGITLDDDDGFKPSIKLQAEVALNEADVILFLVDVLEVVPDDHAILEMLRKATKPIILVTNKCDNDKRELESYSYYEFNLGEPVPISAVHGKNMSGLLERIAELLPNMENEIINPDIKVAIVGKPNTGKSSLLNILLNEERSIVSPIPGTTRDAIHERVTYKNQTIELVDTAGIRRKSRVSDDVEFYSVRRAIRSIRRADLVVHLISAEEGLATQDKKIMAVTANSHKAVIMAVNKWDLLSEDKHLFEEYKEKIRFKFTIAEYIPIVNISALTGFHLTDLLNKVLSVYNDYTLRIDTNTLNEIIESAKARIPNVAKKGELKIYYATQVETNPPKIVLFVNKEELVTDKIKRYIVNKIREKIRLDGVPILIYPRRSE